MKKKMQLTHFLLLILDVSGPVKVSQNVKYVCETDGQVTDTGKFEKLIQCENAGTFSTVPSELPVCRDAIECGLPPTPPDANKLQYATAGPDTSGCQSDDFTQSYEIKLPSQTLLDGTFSPYRKLRQVGCYDVAKFRLVKIDSCALIHSCQLFTNLNFATS